MLTGLVIFFHVLVCLLLGIIILVQSGRGGGLTEQFAAAGEMFGAQTNSLLIKGTTIMASLFLVTCLSLAFLSARKEKSLMAGRIAVPSAESAEDLLQKTIDNAEKISDIVIPMGDQETQPPAESLVAPAVEVKPVETPVTP